MNCRKCTSKHMNRFRAYNEAVERGEANVSAWPLVCNCPGNVSKALLKGANKEYHSAIFNTDEDNITLIALMFEDGSVLEIRGDNIEVEYLEEGY